MSVGADKDNMQLWPFLVRPALGLAQGIVLNRLLGMDILAPLQHGNPYGVAIGVLCVTLIPAALCLAVPVVRPLLALGWAAMLGTVRAGLCAYHVWLSPQPDLQAPTFIAYINRPPNGRAAGCAAHASSWPPGSSLAACGEARRSRRRSGR